MRVNLLSTSVHRLRRWLVRPVAVQRTNTLIAGLCLSVAVLGHAYGKENIMTSKPGLSATAASENKSLPVRRSVQTTSGPVSYVEQGSGPVAFFVHAEFFAEQPFVASPVGGFVGYQALHRGGLAGARRHPNGAGSGRVGHRRCEENATRISRCFGHRQVDLVGNDSGGGSPQDLRGAVCGTGADLTLGDCDTHDNWPPEAFRPFLAMAAGQGLPGRSMQCSQTRVSINRHRPSRNCASP